jgi:lipopolysaccharide transport system permease protein
VNTAGMFHIADKTVRVGARLVHLFNPSRLASAAVDGGYIVKRHWRLALAMAHREMSTRYAGQIMGSFWVVGHPLLQMLIFVFLFGTVFQQRIGGTFELPRDYTIYILAGLVPWLTILPTLTSSCYSIVANSVLVKQFNFELEVLPLKDVLIAMLVWIVGVLIIVVYTIWSYWSVPWTYTLLPLVLLVLIVTLIGFAWLISAVAVFVRDLKDFITVWANLGVFMLPIVYLPQSVPKIFLPIVYGNPLSCMIWIHQDVFYFGRIEHPVSWIIATLFALFMFTSGHRVFQRLRPMFGSVL